MTKRVWLLLACLIMTIGTALAQTRVTGVVLDRQTGEPVAGASVIVKGTSIGDATNVDGQFTIAEVPSSAKTLRVSYIGMKDLEVAVKPKLRIYMDAESHSVDEVLVVAYGTTTKESFTGSASVIKAEDIANDQSSNLLDALNGKSAGVQMYNTTGQPGLSSPTIRIRGISSIVAGNSPLIIMDGAPYDGDLNTINSQDIESLTVLKDAASNSLYGARGANGVIMITTKKAKSGDNGKITVDAKWGANSRATSRYKTIDNPAQYYETYYKSLKNFRMNKGYSEADAHVWARENLIDGDYGLGYNVYNTFGQYLIGDNGKINPNAVMGNVVNYKGQDYMLMADDWVDEAFRTSLRQEYNVTASNVSGGNSFYASFGYLKNEGIVANSDFERLNGRLKADSQLKSWLKIGGNFSFTHYTTSYMSWDGSDLDSGNIFSQASFMAPICPVYIRDGNGNIMIDSNGMKMYDYGDGRNAGVTRFYLPQNNAIQSSIINTNSYEGNSANAIGYAEIRFLKDFKFTTTNTVNLDETRLTNVTNPYYGNYADMNGMVTKSHYRTYTYNYQQLLNWAHQYGKHNVDVMLGHEAYKYKYSYLDASKSNMFDPSNNELAGAVTDGSANSYTTDYNTEGYFGRVRYDYDEKYFGSFSYRRDASSRFKKENRWGNFWSAGAAWLINKEAWFAADWVDMLKFKVSYGEQGNDAIGNFRYTDLYTITNSTSNPALIPDTKGNDKITWEKNGNFNIGADFDLFGGRLSGTVEYFYRKTTDMLFSIPLPSSYGYTSYYANVGNMRNSGIEIDLNGDVIRTKDLTWSLNLNFTHYKNKITHLPSERKTLEVDGKQGYTSGMYFYGEDVPLYTFYMKQWAGVCKETIYDDNGKVIANAGQSLWWKDKTQYVTDANGQYVLDADGNRKTEIVGKEVTANYSEAGFHLCGTALPDIYGGFGTSLTYKGFDLAVDFAYQIGGQCYDSDYAMLMGSPYSSNKGVAMHADLLKAWSPDNASSNIPYLVFGDTYVNATSDRFLTDASYLSLQNINFGYTLPATVTRMAGIDKVRVYVSADNVWIWTKRQGFDPRQSISGYTTNQYYAPIRSISGGITITF
ncbi:MAG: TonB-dependent receptor [Bacteroides sp.]|nr:TonB-dependent receptor [Roseburia sp.]MCM1346065.1 TonB-dependent receptor [Bacteroides sp.]MCM1420588.1 TonB-dependent receptor [Bacteroides sp.]